MPAILKEICGARKGVVNQGTKTLREHLPINLVPNNRSRLRIFTLKILLMYILCNNHLFSRPVLVVSQSKPTQFILLICSLGQNYLITSPCGILQRPKLFQNTPY